MLLKVIFLVMSAITLGSALLMVTSRNLFHSALFMAASFLGVAGLYILLEAEFLAVVQILIYVGAIATLIVFAIMVSRGLMRGTEPSVNTQWPIVAVGALLLFGILAFIAAQARSPLPASDPPGDIIARIGQAFVSTYVIPFEVASALLVIAMIGAIIIAREKE
ncbi:MAG TPA: NADH-quinone oxidoreductase subunit J [Caldilineae bacterium]|jgi:NADH-quinone oxidoreductase subunit J|nr:NADH-quinone oxidoreductase subunit J [Caldilineae bacterium]